MARFYMQTTNLCGLLLKSGCPEVIQHSRHIFEKLLSPLGQDSLCTTSIAEDEDDVDERHARPIPSEIQTALARANLKVPSRAIFQTSININSLRYAIASKHPGNSCVMVSSVGGSPRPAQLNYILEFGNSTDPLTYLAVRHYKSLNITHDPFAKYPVLAAKLWDSHLADVEMISMSQVLSHFACLPVQMQSCSLVAVLSLSRISSIP